MMRLVGVVVVCAAVGGCASHRCVDEPRIAVNRNDGGEKQAVGMMVDAWHDAAARGDLDAYFGRMTDDAVFLGTDDTERWGRAEFLAFAEPYFDGPTTYGEGAWTYKPVERHVMLDQRGAIAWFDEKLDSPSYGRCRGTGVCVLGRDGHWRIAHYSLTFPVPNDVAGEVIGIIRARAAGDGTEGNADMKAD